MHECLRVLELLNHHLGVIAKLQSPVLTQKHLRAICEGQKLCPATLQHQISIIIASKHMICCRYWSAV